MAQYLFSDEGKAAIATCLARRPLLAFDFDGTLAPIVHQPDLASPSPAVAAAMTRLCALAPVAVVTGRAIADAQRRLGFTPRHVVGNHGAEGRGGEYTGIPQLAPQAWRDALAALAADFEVFGIAVEDKGQSITLHYRQAADPDQARRMIEAAAAGLRPAPRVIGGKAVVNLLPAGAPDKYAAISGLLALEGRSTAIFIGDDLTDDAVFEQAPPDWLTVRVEPDGSTRARFFLPAQAEVEAFVQTLIDGLQALPPETGAPA